MRILAVDAGNSRIKWGLREDQEWLALGATDHTGIDSLTENWRNIPAPHKVIVSNVAGEKAHADLQKIFSIWSAHCKWVSAKSTECGVSNGYEDPAQLGSDRWAALIAAWDLRHAACLVVNAGTAMTVDGLNDKGEFLGGVIVPGFRAMRQVLAQSTATISLCHLPQGTRRGTLCQRLAHRTKSGDNHPAQEFPFVVQTIHRHRCACIHYQTCRMTQIPCCYQRCPTI